MSGYSLFLTTVCERCGSDHISELFWCWPVEGSGLALETLLFYLCLLLPCQVDLVNSPNTYSASSHSQDEDCTTPSFQDVSSSFIIVDVFPVLSGKRLKGYILGKEASKCEDLGLLGFITSCILNNRYN